MAKKKKQAAQAVGDRYEDLKQMLVERQREIMNEVRGKMRDVRSEAADNSSVDPASDPDIDIREDIEFSLIQMKAETLNKINEALARLEEGTYGHCGSCGDEIGKTRLNALPFAIRCKDCEEAKEMQIQRERIQARRGGKK